MPEGNVALTEELVAGIVAKAIGDHQKTLESKFAAMPTAAGLEEMIKRLIPAPVVPPVVVPDDKKGTPAENAEVLLLKKKLEDLTKAQDTEIGLRKTAEAKQLATDKETKIRTAMTAFDFLTDDAREDCYAALDKAVTRNDAGELIANDLPVDAFVKDFVPGKKAYLLKPENVSGGGIAPSGGRLAGGKKATMEMISPNMTKEESNAVGAAIQAAAREANGIK